MGFVNAFVALSMLAGAAAFVVTGGGVTSSRSNIARERVGAVGARGMGFSSSSSSSSGRLGTKRPMPAQVRVTRHWRRARLSLGVMGKGGDEDKEEGKEEGKKEGKEEEAMIDFDFSGQDADDILNTYSLQYKTANLADILKGTPIYLVGMMGTGKSTAAKRLAEKMITYRCVDTDYVVEQLYGDTVAACIEEEGIEGFRSLETQVLDSMQAFIKTVVSTGGGVVVNVDNWARMQTGLVVWMDMPVEDIAARMADLPPEELSKRPLLKGDAADVKNKLEAILEERYKMYDQADVRVTLGKEDSEDDVVENIVSTLTEFIESNPPKWQTWKAAAKEEGVSWL